MNKMNLMFASGLGLLLITFNSFGKSVDVRANEKKSNLYVAVKDTSTEYQKFKEDAEVKMKQFDKDIAKLKAKAKNADKAAQDKYNKDVAALEQKNKELKKQLEKDQKMDKAKMKSFEKDFDKSMDDLGKSIKDLF